MATQAAVATHKRGESRKHTFPIYKQVINKFKQQQGRDGKHDRRYISDISNVFQI